MRARAGSKPARPEWADRLEQLREHLGLSQASLARRLNVSAMAASRWERGVNQPTASIYLQLGKMAGAPECWYFWERAGLNRSDVIDVLPRARRLGEPKAPRLEIVPAAGVEQELHGVKQSSNLVAVPLLNTERPIGTTGSNHIQREGKRDFVVSHRSWSPHPAETIALRMGGEKMAPILQPGYIVAVDESQTESRQLEGKMVLATHREHGLEVLWLQRFGKAQMLVPENRNFPPQYLHNGDWTIIGKVVWWIGKAA